MACALVLEPVRVTGNCSVDSPRLSAACFRQVALAYDAVRFRQKRTAFNLIEVLVFRGRENLV